MLFLKNNSFQKTYRAVDMKDCIYWLNENKKPNRIDIKVINEYLRSKGFLGYVIKKQRRYIIFAPDKEPLKMFIDLNSMFNYLELKANTIEINFKGHRAKTLITKKAV